MTLLKINNIADIRHHLIDCALHVTWTAIPCISYNEITCCRLDKKR